MAALQQWLADCIARTTQAGDGDCETDHHTGRLNVHFHGMVAKDQYLIRLSAAEPSPKAMPLLQDFGLTQREREVLEWLAKGKTNRDIADILGLSPRTVDKHLEHIYIKLGVETRTAAAALLHSPHVPAREPQLLKP
jgi:DNA-binding CsgD family transcriptional regulator